MSINRQFAAHGPRQSSITKLLAVCLSLAALASTAQTGSVTLAWNATANRTLAGYDIYYGPASGTYTSNFNASSNLTVTVAGLTPGATYYFAVMSYASNGIVSPFSSEASGQVPVPASITSQPSSEAAVAGATVTFNVGAAGDAPLSFQWLAGAKPIPGATTSSLSIVTSNAGSYSIVVANPWGSVTSSVASLAVVIPPSVTKQPSSQSVVATAAASFTSSASGTAPMAIQWYCGNTPLPGATNSTLAWASVAPANAGNYRFTVSNAGGVATSTVATLTVYPSNMFASVAGVYNGLFYQTNANGTPAVTEATSGFLGNCVVAANGAFSAKLLAGGQSYAWSGNFDTTGSHVATILQSNGTASTLNVTLQLNLTTLEMTGFVSNAVSSNAWSAPLLVVQATNGSTNATVVSLAITPESSAGAPTNSISASGVVLNGVLALAGVLGDSTSFSQSVPVSQDGYAPIYVSLYNNGGLLEGWINVSSGAVAGTLTWIRPSGALVPAGFPQGFDVEANVTGGTISK